MMPDCLFYAVQIERTFEIVQWKSELENVPEECRSECREYLLGIHQRRKNQILCVKSMGFETVEQHKGFLEAKKRNDLLTPEVYLKHLRSQN